MVEQAHIKINIMDSEPVRQALGDLQMRLESALESEQTMAQMYREALDVVRAAEVWASMVWSWTGKGGPLRKVPGSIAGAQELLDAVEQYQKLQEAARGGTGKPA